MAEIEKQSMNLCLLIKGFLREYERDLKMFIANANVSQKNDSFGKIKTTLLLFNFL